MPSKPRFFGIHFDFHANDESDRVGFDLDERELARFLRTVRPDYVQTDGKGHRGLASWCTEVGSQAPGIAVDPLPIWRRVSQSLGIDLYCHYSGVWDTEAVARHPEWAARDAKGRRDRENTSVFGPYVDELLIPQIEELHHRYGIDGVWIDGDCWSAQVDYSRHARKAWKALGHTTPPPRSPDDPLHAEYMDMCRVGFRRYLGHYVDTLHARCPGLQVISNWAYSAKMPEPVDTEVDALSGDYPLNDAVRMARLEARYLARQGQPWDLMAWGFCARWGELARSVKTATQLTQEAAVVLAQGGGFQVYLKQDRQGRPMTWMAEALAEVGAFCRARRSWCYGSEAIPQVGLLHSASGFKAAASHPYRDWGGERHQVQGVFNALIDGQHVTDVVSEHHLEQRAYPVLVIPEWTTLEPDSISRALAQVHDHGGSLLLIGPRTAQLFDTAGALGVEAQGAIEERYWSIGLDGAYARHHSEALRVRPQHGTKTIALLADDEFHPGGSPFATVRTYGKGRIAAIWGEFGSSYRHGSTSVTRDALARVIAALHPDPLVRVTGSHLVEVVANRNPAGKVQIELLNGAGAHAHEGTYVFDEIPPLGPLTVAIRCPRKPRAITLQPEGEKLRMRWADGVATVTVERLAIHAIIELEQGSDTRRAMARRKKAPPA